MSVDLEAGLSSGTDLDHNQHAQHDHMPDTAQAQVQQNHLHVILSTVE